MKIWWQTIENYRTKAQTWSANERANKRPCELRSIQFNSNHRTRDKSKRINWTWRIHLFSLLLQSLYIEWNFVFVDRIRIDYSESMVHFVKTKQILLCNKRCHSILVADSHTQYLKVLVSLSIVDGKMLMYRIVRCILSLEFNQIAFVLLWNYATMLLWNATKSTEYTKLDVGFLSGNCDFRSFCAVLHPLPATIDVYTNDKRYFLSLLLLL